MKYYLIKYEDNWADEFDIETFSVMNEEQYNNFNNDLNNIISEIKDEEVEIYFGTNEEITITPSEFQNSLKITEIQKDFYDSIIRYGLNDYGLISIPLILENFKYE